MHQIEPCPPFALEIYGNMTDSYNKGLNGFDILKIGFRSLFLLLLFSSFSSFSSPYKR